MRFEQRQATEDAVLEELDAAQAEASAQRPPEPSYLDANGDGKVGTDDAALAVLRLLDLDDDGDLDLWDLVALPPALLRLLGLFFGVLWRALPFTAILGTDTVSLHAVVCVHSYNSGMLSIRWCSMTARAQLFAAV